MAGTKTHIYKMQNATHWQKIIIHLHTQSAISALVVRLGFLIRNEGPVDYILHSVARWGRHLHRRAGGLSGGDQALHGWVQPQGPLSAATVLWTFKLLPGRLGSWLLSKAGIPQASAL